MLEKLSLMPNNSKTEQRDVAPFLRVIDIHAVGVIILDSIRDSADIFHH